MSGSKSPRNPVADHVASLPKSGIRDFFELVAAMDDVISLGVGEPDFVTPWGIREATIYALEKGHTQYTSNLGLLSLRQECCRYVGREFGVEYDPVKECIITVGVSEALDLVLRAVINPGDEIIYHTPCYVSYGPSIKLAHGIPVAIETRESDAFALDPQRLADAVTPRTKAILLNFPNNPTGGNLSEEQKAEIAKIAVANDLLVITDEIYAELTYGGYGTCIASYPGMRERTVFLHGFSKAYAMTGYRVGYACGPFALIDAMMKIHQYSMLCASIISQEAAVEAFRNGKQDMLRMVAEYEQRRNVITNRLNALGLDCLKPDGAFYVFPNVSASGLTSEEFARQLLAEESVAVVPGTAFGSGEFAAKHVRCSYASSMEQIETACERIGAFLQRRGVTAAS